MSRPVWSSAQSSFDASPASGLPGDGGAKSFKTNVNRQKTKRWVEAKTVSYDGDDWGEVDDYDEYQASQATPPPPPPSISKPTGLRQRGQSVGVPASSAVQAEGSAGVAPETPYRTPDARPPPTVIEERPGWAGATREMESPLTRRGVLPAQDQSHATTSQVPSGQYDEVRTAPTRFSQMETGPTGHPYPGQDSRPVADGAMQPDQPSGRRPSRDTPPFQIDAATAVVAQPVPAQNEHMGAPYPRPTGGESGGEPGRSNWSAVDVSPRQDPPVPAFRDPRQPSAHPATEQPVSASPASYFPPRKSSLTQTGPLVPDPARGSPHAPVSAAPPSREMSPAAVAGRARTASSVSQTRPFIRPADIYKRIEEERSRERRPSESTRRSMDSTASRPTDADIMSGSGVLDARQSSESARQDEELEQARRAKSKLDPVTERRSEYGMDGLLARDGGSSSKGANLGDNTAAPLLPDLARLSGFGAGLWNTSTSINNNNQPSFPVVEGSGIASDQIIAPALDNTTVEKSAVLAPLQHQPSLGFRSVVHHAFDQPAEKSLPATPSSLHGSLHSGTAAAPQRSDSSSTLGISPIMAHAPSAAGNGSKRRDDVPRDGDITAIAEEAPAHSGTTPNTPTARSGKADASDTTHVFAPAPDPRPGSSESLPPTVRAGHRRDLSTPSPNNSPARSPHIEVNEGLPEGEEATVGVTSPVDGQDAPPEQSLVPPLASIVARDEQRTTHDHAPSLGPANNGLGAIHNGHAKGNSEPEEGRSGTDSETLTRPASTTSTGPDEDSGRSPVTKAAAALHSRVRDLAGKFEPSSMKRAPSPQKSRPDDPADYPSDTGEQVAHRPEAPQRDSSFRPALPGGWVSYGPAAEGGTPPAAPTAAPAQQPSRLANSQVPQEDAPSTADDETSKPSDLEIQESSDVPDDGVDSRPSPDPTSNRISTASKTSEVGPGQAIRQTPSPMTAAPESQGRGTSEGSSLPPTPPPKDSTFSETSPTSQSDYFTTPLAPRKHSPSRQQFGLDARVIPGDPPALPDLSTDNSPRDQESDKLRKEIVKSLNLPDLSGTTAHPISWSQYQPDSPGRLGEPDRDAPNRESTALPAEYDSYWASTGHDAEPGPVSVHVPSESEPQRQYQQPFSGGEPERTHEDGPILPSASDRASRLSVEHDGSIHHAEPQPVSRPARMDHLDQNGLRLSTHEPASSMPGTGQGPGVDPEYDPIRHYTASSSPEGEGDGSGFADGGTTQGKARDSELGLGTEPPPARDPEASGAQEPSLDDPPYLQPSTAVTAASHPQPETGDVPAKDSSSIDLEDRPLVVSHEPLWATPQRMSGEVASALPLEGQAGLSTATPARVEDEYQRPPDAAYLPISADQVPELEGLRGDTALENEKIHVQPSPPAVPPTDRPVVTAAGPSDHVAATPLSFQEISTLKTPQERIRAYNAARQHFANRNTGLVSWLTAVRSPNPMYTGPVPSPHARQSADGARPPGAPIPGADLFSGPTAGAGANTSPTSQQPYYQQYLHFSDSAQGSTAGHAKTQSVSNTGPVDAPPSSSHHGGGGGGGVKLSRDQMQAKGKDLLHTAGVLGGKANVAAKGLFSKGKNRLRASGADKADH